MRRFLLCVIVLASFSTLYANVGRGDFQQRFLEANQLMEEKLWNKSIDIWLTLFAENATNANVNYKLGYCYLQTSNEKLKSLPYLQAAATKEVTLKYDPYDPGETNAPVEAYYYLGRAYHLKYELDKAIATYDELLTMIPKKHRLYKDAEHQRQMCVEAKYQIEHPQNYVITNVGPKINNDANDYSPVLSLDETAMFYTSRRMRSDSTNSEITDFDTGEWKEDIYVSYKDAMGEWQSPELLDINTDEHAATISVSPDGQTLFIYYDEGGNGQIYQSVLIGETWSDPEMLGSDINTDAWETHASLSPDGKTLYFVSNREGGFGGRDIYRCVKLPNDEWSKALNVGATINTEYEEDAVFISADGKTLYFASTGHNSMGGFDIFYSVLGDDEKWSIPVNIGYPVNTVDDDVFFFPTADQKRAYYSSRKEEGYGLKDIYLIDMPDTPIETDLAVLKGFIIAPPGEELPEDCYILVTNNKNGEVTEYKPRSRDGAYVAVLPPCMGYHIEYVVNQDIIQEEFINVPCESAYSVIDKEVHLLPVHLKGAGAAEEEEGGEEPVAEIEEEHPDTGFDPANPVNVEVAEANAYFERFFIYDAGEWSLAEDKFAEFMTGVKKIIETQGSVKLKVESSASNVPSSRFNNNTELTEHRNKTARDQIKDALVKAGYKEGTDFTFTRPVELVQGPKYGNDAYNKSKYEPFQYIKVWADVKK
ncbi:MAG: PD40 domain-containing protein [Flavobacteriales bacterium]|nr:PD40 domain-containing protein [Flavobacteriales bacterium]